MAGESRILLIHGAFGGAWSWEPVIPGLRAAGHTVEAIDLPGAGADRTPVAEVSLRRYAERISEQLADGPPAILVGHSMGGMAITQAAGLHPDFVAGLIYVAAFLPNPGESLIDLTRYPEAADDQVQANLTVDGDPPVATMSARGARIAVCHLATDEQAAWADERRGRQPVLPFTQPFTLSDASGDAFAALPRAYVTCLQDRAINPALQQLMFTRAGCDPIVEIDTDHSPSLTATDELVSALDRIARELAPAR
jgi:pimeloyl-ACP methyl ester carboxylesterase